jgi:hypothetical protein
MSDYYNEKPQNQTVRCSENNSFKRKGRVGWIILAGVIIIVTISSILAVLTLPQKISAFQHSNQRDLSTPSSRLVGHWKNFDGNGEVYYNIIDSSLKVGTKRLRNEPYGNFGPPIRFKIVHEEPSGDHLVIREYNDALLKLGAELGIDTRKSDITICVPKQGQSMSQEYIFCSGGSNTLQVYRYVDDKIDP